MNQHPPFRLCGGTFFALLSTARKASIPKKDQLSGKRSGQAESDLFLALAKIIFPNLPPPTEREDQTLRDSILKFKKCQNWGWSGARLKESHTREIFSARLRDEYAAAVQSMKEIVQSFVDLETGQDEWLCKALLLLIEQDDSISSSQEFYVRPDGTPMTKAELCQKDTLYIAPFLLGVWHFCVCHREDNTCGRETYENWFPQCQSHGKRTFQATFVSESQRNITVSHEFPPMPTDEHVHTEGYSHADEENQSSFAQEDAISSAATSLIQNVFNQPLSHITINATGTKIIQSGDHCVFNFNKD